MSAAAVDENTQRLIDNPMEVPGMSLEDLFGAETEDDNRPYIKPENPLPVWSVEEFQRHPLFMKEAPSNIEGNEHLEGLQSILYDGETPESLAENFKDNGNECLRRGQIGYKDAEIWYTRGLEQNSSDKKVNSMLYSNRAAVRLLQSNFPQVVSDCSRAIELDETNVKACYRGAKAAFELGLWTKCSTFVTTGLKQDPDNTSLKHLGVQVEAKIAAKETKVAAKAETKAKLEEMKKQKINLLLKARGLEAVKPLYDLPSYMDTLHIADGALVWPAVFLYVEVNQMDMIEAFDEDATPNDHLRVMFSGDEFPTWDYRKRYVWDKLVLYLETVVSPTKSEMILLKNDVPLKDQMTDCRVPRILPIHVMLKDSAAHQDFLEDYDIIKK